MNIYRSRNELSFKACLTANYTPVQATIIANRIDNPLIAKEMASNDLSAIEPYSQLLNATYAGEVIAEAVRSRKRIGLLTDYDVDGITSNAMMQHALCDMMHYPPDLLYILVGHRIHDSYGISDSLAGKILAIPQSERPELIITADCGSSDEERIQLLAKHGISVIVTDHHAIPKSGVPCSALTVVNPWQKGCQYQDKSIAGVATAWLVMWAAYDYSYKKKWTDLHNPTSLWDFVALGTVADCVSIASQTNRLFVRHGLKMINSGIRPCWHAVQLAQQDKQTSIDEGALGFQIGPRINACSRMNSPYLGIDFLMACNIEEAEFYYAQLTKANEDRKEKESEMTLVCKKLISDCMVQDPDCVSIVAYDPSFHPGVQGIVASRIVEQTGKPSFVFSPSRDGLLSASGRTVARINLRDALQYIDDRDPSIFNRYGGHKASCGAHIYASKLGEFKQLFDSAVRHQLGNDKLEQTVISDGDITQLGPISLSSYYEISQLSPFGREFESPIFTSRFKIIQSVPVGKTKKNHLKLVIQDKHGIQYSGIWFSALSTEDDVIPVVQDRTYIMNYELSENRFNNSSSLQLIIKSVGE